MIAWHPEGRWSSDAEGLDGRYYADRIVGHFTAAAALLNLLVAVKLVDDSGYATGLEPGQRDVQAMSSLDAYIYGWRIGLVFFGVHLLLVGYVIVKSDYVPRILGRLVALAGLGFVLMMLAGVLWPDSKDLYLLLLAVVAIPPNAAPRAVGE